MFHVEHEAGGLAIYPKLGPSPMRHKHPEPSRASFAALNDRRQEPTHVRPDLTQ